MTRSVALAFALLLAGCTAPGSGDVARPEPNGLAPPTSNSPDGAPSGAAIRLDPFLAGFDRPLLLTHGADGDELYVVEQPGRVTLVSGDGRAVVHDVTADISSGGERGLLGFAISPHDGSHFLSYTDLTGDSVLLRVHTNGTREVVLQVAQPYANHNGGHILFGPDGHLWFGLGDGGSAGDPRGNGQDPNALLGSLLRIDVSGAWGYAVPDDNPYAASGGAKEVFAKGLRNPWRFSFDRQTSDLYIGDVGQNAVEEIDFLAAGTGAGTNFGWNTYEGTQRFNLLGVPFAPVTNPVAEYPHDDGCSVTGGFVYRGSAHPQLAGIYFLGDYCSGRIWGLREKADIWRLIEILDTDRAITSFGEDAAGELYVVDHGGEVLRLVGTGAPLPAPLEP